MAIPWYPREHILIDEALEDERARLRRAYRWRSLVYFSLGLSVGGVAARWITGCW